MLVLVSFGLVLLATILLVVGLLNDDGLTLIYLSIAASVTAAVVLYFAFRRARPKDEAPTAPAPLVGDAADTAVAAAPSVAVAEEAPAPSAAPPEPDREADEQEPGDGERDEEAPVAEEDGWSAEDEGWADDDGEFEFPIADYDDLKVGEIMPLLPQLYSDELEVVAERERAGKNRSTILDRLAELSETGTEADRLEAEEAEDAPAPSAPSAPVASSSADGEWPDDEDFFPIADYDDLTVAQILPLLPKLELDELEDVKSREIDGAARKSLITEIDRYLSGELEVDGYDEMDDAPTPPPRPAAKKAAKKAARKTGKKRAKKAAKKTTKKSWRSSTTAAKTSAKKTASKTARKTSKKSAKKRTTTRFPIGNYDNLTVAEIRPRLTSLSAAQLRQVRTRERGGAGRKTILDAIDDQLG